MTRKELGKKIELARLTRFLSRSDVADRMSTGENKNGRSNERQSLMLRLRKLERGEMKHVDVFFLDAVGRALGVDILKMIYTDAKDVHR